ncbi:MAG: aromatic amino acid ammonia-lyase [Desulfurococcales archaeon]|nr:aromatic amino acid ammonia-lyase [Desulfurococcales archaeon]
MAGGSVVVSPSRCPSLEDLHLASQGARVVVEHSVYSLLDEARAVYLREAERRSVYGYCTGLGDLYSAKARCGPGFEERVLREHAAGAGPYAPEWMARAFLYARLSQLARGRAPVRGVVAGRIAEALNHGVVPAIPLYGSVGASGDLAPSAHAFLCTHLGIGYALSGGGLEPCRDALARAGLEPLALEPGEALALINNTAWSTALAGLGVYYSLHLLGESLEAAGESLGVTGCNPEHFSSGLLEARPLLDRDTMVEGCSGDRLQDPYSIRCIPQVYSAVKAALAHARGMVEAELCSSTENPLVAGGRVIHSCSFHSIAAGLAADYAGLALASLANMVERRIAQLMRSSITGLPEYLAGEDSSVGAMIIQYTAASLAARVRRLAQPSTVHNIPTSGLQEDIVPMSPDSGLKLLSIVDALAWLVAAERLVTNIARGVEGLDDPSGGLRRYHSMISRRLGLPSLGDAVLQG